MDATSRSRQNSQMLSVVLVIALTLAALLLGWLYKESLLNQTFSLTHGTVRAEIPAGWQVQEGIADEEMAFTAFDPLDTIHRYTVSVLPAVPGGKVTDSVSGRNLNLGQQLASFKVVEQTPVQVAGRSAYKVGYGYVITRSGDLPQVVQAADYYILQGSHVLVITVEDTVTNFDAGLPAFFRFLGRVTSTGG